MVKATLVESDIRAGQALIDALDRTDLTVQTALWYYKEEPEYWELNIASPFVDRHGAKKALGIIQEVLKELPAESRPSFLDIRLVRPKDPLIRLIRQQFRIGPGDPPYRLQRGAIDQTYIDDAYIYRSQ